MRCWMAEPMVENAYANESSSGPSKNFDTCRRPTWLDAGGKLLRQLFPFSLHLRL